MEVADVPRAPRIVETETVTCRGPKADRHQPVELTLPEGRTVICPVCGLCYRRQPGLRFVAGATWPKQQ